MEAGSSTETSVTIYQWTERHNPSWKFKSHIEWFLFFAWRILSSCRSLTGDAVLCIVQSAWLSRHVRTRIALNFAFKSRITSPFAQTFCWLVKGRNYWCKCDCWHVLNKTYHLSPALHNWIIRRTNATWARRVPHNFVFRGVWERGGEGGSSSSIFGTKTGYSDILSKYDILPSYTTY